MYKLEKCNLTDFNKHLAYCKQACMIVRRERTKDDRGYIANLVVKRVNIELTYKKPGVRLKTYVFRLDGNITDDNQGQVAYRTLLHYVKKYDKDIELDIRDDKNFGYKEKTCIVNKGKPNQYENRSYSWGIGIGSAKAILYYNNKFNGTRQENCYGYDLNSAYTSAMLNKMPNTNVKPLQYRMVKPGQIGFKNIAGEFKAVFSGIADYVFPLMDSPFEEFAKVWYEKKKNAKDKIEKSKAKHMLNDAVGYLQIVNPFMRAAIITYANMKIESLIDENTLYCNTDSIVSKTKRLDIEKNLGKELGQWKIEHEGSFAYDGYNYQWNKDLPSWRGVVKSTIPEDYDILSRESVKTVFKYYLDEKKLKIKEK